MFPIRGYTRSAVYVLFLDSLCGVAMRRVPWCCTTGIAACCALGCLSRSTGVHRGPSGMPHEPHPGLVKTRTARLLAAREDGPGS